MFVILGANGHVGSATARTLLANGHAVTAVMHDARAGDAWTQAGASVAVVDVHDVDALRAVFRSGKRAFLLNPPAPPSTDTDLEERATARCLLQALEGSGLEKVVAESTMGAQPGEALGDLSVLYEFEQGLKAQPIPCGIIRAAYYLSNWDAAMDATRASGKLPTMFPADLKMPMVAPDDLGRAAAAFLAEPIAVTGTRYVEGPVRYSATDVADAIAAALHRPVRVEVTPRDRWEAAFGEQGFSPAAARSFARMTAAIVDGEFPSSASTIHGVVTLTEYIQALVARSR